MAVIPQMENGTELTYLDLLNMLVADIENDQCMPQKTREQALNLLQELSDTILPYSG